MPIPEGITVDSFTGVWQQVDGSSILTINGKDWEILDIERGIAGFGNNIKIVQRKTEVYVDFIYKNGYILDMGKYSNLNDRYKEPLSSINGVKIRDFMLTAWKDYKTPIGEREWGSTVSTGNIFLYFNFDGNYMELTPMFNHNNDDNYIFVNFDRGLTGKFVRIR